MKKIIFFFLVALTTFSALLHSQEHSALDNSSLPADIRAIKERGYIIVSMYYKDIMPFMFHDEQGNFIGHEVELVKKIAAALEVSYRFNRSPKTIAETIELVAEGSADMAVSAIGRTLARAQKVRFTRPYIVFRPIALVNRIAISKYVSDPSNPLKSLTVLSLDIAEKENTAYVRKAKNLFVNAIVTEYKEWQEAIEAMLQPHNPVEVVIMDEIGTKNYIAENPQQLVNLQTVPIADEQYHEPLAIAVNKNALHLQAWLNLFFVQNGVTGNADSLLAPYQKYYE